MWLFMNTYVRMYSYLHICMCMHTHNHIYSHMLHFLYLTNKFNRCVSLVFLLKETIQFQIN